MLSIMTNILLICAIIIAILSAIIMIIGFVKERRDVADKALVTSITALVCIAGLMMCMTYLLK